MAIDLTTTPSEGADRPRLAGRPLRRVLIAAGVGSVIEYYDFGVYAFLATTLAVVFFPAQDPATALLSTLAIFASAFVMRPIGGVVIGHIGDHFGRKAGLATAVIMMAVCTAAIGLIPSHASIGIAAPILLVLLRCGQGFAAGGELGGASSYVAESVADDRRGLFSSIPQLGCLAGTALGSLTVAVLTLLLTAEQMQDWGWRVPFLFSVVLSVAAVLFRRKMTESPDFESLEAGEAIRKLPVLEALKNHPWAIASVFGINLVSFAAFYLIFTYMTTYFEVVDVMSARSASWAVVVTQILAAFSIPFWGHISDRIGRKPVLVGVCVANIVFAIPMFALIGSGNTELALVCLVVLGQFEGAYLGVISSCYCEMFPASVRASGFNLGFNLSAIIAGGAAPYIATWLIERTGDDKSPAYFLTAAAALSLLTVWKIKETAGKPLPLDG